jgi:hypothetical protein
VLALLPLALLTLSCASSNPGTGRAATDPQATHCVAEDVPGIPDASERPGPALTRPALAAARGGNGRAPVPEGGGLSLARGGDGPTHEQVETD